MKFKSKDYIFFFLASFSLFVIWLTDTLIPSNIMIVSLYSIPILISAHRFNYKIIAIFTLITITVWSIHANSLHHYSLVDILLHDAGLIVIGILTIQLNSKKLKSEQLKNDADTAKKQLEIFMNTIAHDLMQPITVAKLYAGMFDKSINKNAKNLQNNFSGAINTLEQLASDLRDAGLIRSGQFTLNPSKTNLYELLKEIIAQHQIISSNHKIKLDAPLRLKANLDRERLKQVFNNLLGNAVKYSPEGGEIKVIVKKNDSSIIVSVADTGIGMARHQYRLLFKPFARINNIKKTFKGSGLGLYISKSIIKAHQGELWVTSKKGKGSTFFVKLPLA